MPVQHIRHPIENISFVLDATGRLHCTAPMKMKFLAGFLGLAVLAVGCVDTVGGRKTAGVPFIKDKIQARYQVPLEQAFDAAKEVINAKGVLVSENTLYNQTNAVNNLAKTIEGKVNQRSVWVRVEQIEPKISDVTVQTRTQGGGSDIDLAAQIDKEIALKLQAR